MPLAAGTRIGPYEILAPLGAGGMGEVYRARDTKLDRDVAIKVLPHLLANDPERLARFEREAKVLASLNHPHIAQIYGIEERALVMELVKGATLTGPLPLDEALHYAGQIASALEAAHEKGIIHRDLKPANIMITPEGPQASMAKVLDFGLAAVTQPSSDGDPGNSPTLTMSPTRAGMILGTAAYMSPEQARGKPVDKRADIWAFGVVLYEMLTGERLFAGETVSDILAQVLTKDPDLTRAPTKARRLLRRCLEKDPKNRLRDIGDAMPLLEDSQGGAAPSVPARRGSWIPWATACLLLAGAAAWAWLRTPPAESHPVSRWTETVEGAAVDAGLGLALSPDGARMAYRSGDRLWIRELNGSEAKPIQGTEGGMRPFFSPDGQWIGYFMGANGSLRKVPVTAGAPITLCDGWFFGGSWGDDDRIVFSTDVGLVRVSASGGACENLTKADPKKGEHHRWPQILPGGQSVLFNIGVEGSFDKAQIAVLDLKSREYRVVAAVGARPRYVPSGHIVYVRAGAIFAAPFDLKRLAVTGGEVPVADSVYYNSAGGFADYAVSNSGLLVYTRDTRAIAQSSLEWRDRKGAAQPVPALPQSYAGLGISPDGLRAVVMMGVRGGNMSLGVLDLARGTSVRLPSDSVNYSPVWTPDGRRLAFGSTRNSAVNWTSADGSGKPEVLVVSRASPSFWTPDGKTLVYSSGPPSRLWSLQVPGGKPQPLFEASSGDLSDARISPDGKWVAYTSDESGKNQIYARQFPDGGGKVAISINGGQEPRWSRDGRELFYRDAAKNELMAVDMQTAPAFRAGQPTALFTLPSPYWDAAPDGKRFLVVRPSEAAGGPTTVKMQVVVNWFDELRQKVPAGKK